MYWNMKRQSITWYMSFLDDSRTPNVFGWACRFVLGKPAAMRIPHPHRCHFPPSTHHPPTVHPPSTHCPPAVHQPCHLPISVQRLVNGLNRKNLSAFEMFAETTG